jgi:hypothetical protein
MGNHEARHDSPRSCRHALSKNCQRIHKTRQNKKRSHKKKTRDFWNTRREIQTQTKLDQPSWKNGQHQTPETRPSTTDLEEEEIVDAPGNDGNASMPEQVRRPSPWKKKKMKMMMMISNILPYRNWSTSEFDVYQAPKQRMGRIAC